MFITRVTCDASRPGIDTNPCPYLDVIAEKPDDVPDAFDATLTAAGWCETDNAQYCPRHNPALAGLPVIPGRTASGLILGNGS